MRATFCLAASSFAPFCMATKNGLAESLVMRATPIFSVPSVLPEPLSSPEPQAAAPSARPTIPTDASTLRAVREDET